MSWFDTVGIANIAKSALKEAQKQIDKALDIQDDELVVPSKVKTEKSKTAPTTPMQDAVNPKSWKGAGPNTSTWGSFSGSFFETSKSCEMITTPPTSGQSPKVDAVKRESIQSNSDSVDLVSPPTSPGLSLSSMTMQQSDSVELISMPPSSELFSPVSDKSPESVEVISCEEAIEEEEEDSISFNTVTDESLFNSNELKFVNISESTESAQTVIEQQTISSPAIVDTILDSQTILSDSTQSFEEVNIPDCRSSTDDKDTAKHHDSGRLSDQNSTDDVETTTSSDIEIISNPNGDSSSGISAYRSSPLKLMAGKKSTALGDFKIVNKGHCRMPSEVSTQSDDSSQTENDKLLMRVNELNEILEAREVRLLELSRENSSLLDKNSELTSQLEARKTQTKHIESEEYTERLSSLEKKFQSAIRERDAVKAQLKSAQEELGTKVAKDDLNKIVNEKDFMIAELRTEGEKLAKQILQHSNIIKKLRTKEKESDASLKKNKEQIEVLSEEVERLKKSLTAKEEVERSQIEAVHKLCSEKRKLEKENLAMRSELEDTSSKLKSMQISFDAVKKELTNRQEAQLELTRKAETLDSVEKEKQKAQTHNLEVTTQLEEMREKLKQAENSITQREQKLRQENTTLLRRLEASESRAEQLTQEVSISTIPLVRQLNALQNTLDSRTKNWEQQEKELIARFEKSQEQLQAFENAKKSSAGEFSLLKARIANLEDKLSTAHLNHEQVSASLQQTEIEYSLKEDDYKRKINELQIKVNELVETVKVCKENEKIFEDSNSTPVNVAKPKLVLDKEQTIEAVVDGNVSPTPSLGHHSIADSLSSSTWQVDDLECISNSGRQPGSVYGFNLGYVPIGHTATTLETLQSNLKQKEGEVCQLQWEISRLQSERSVLNAEIVDLTLQLEQIKEQLESHDNMEKEFTELKTQYDALLQMYGEKVEETQELELDLQDVKDMYKAQLDEILMLKNRKP